MIELKETLLERPIRLLFDEPHFLSAWLSQHRRDFVVRDDQVEWQRNPVEVLAETYRLLDMDNAQTRGGLPHLGSRPRAAGHGARVLREARGAACRPGRRGPTSTPRCAATRRPFGFDEATWAPVRAAHAGHQLGLDILALLPLIADTIGFYDLALEDDLSVRIPERLHDPAHQEAMRKVLVPPPVTKRRRDRGRDGRHLLLAGSSRPAALRHHGAPLRSRRPALHHRGDEDVQQGVRELRGHRHRGAGDRRHGRAQGPAAVPDRPDEVFVEEDPAERERRLRASTEAYLERLG